MKLTASPLILDFKTVIVGASVAGCCTALRLADNGIKVAIIDKQLKLQQTDKHPHYKKMCSHIIHPSGVEALNKIGILNALMKEGAQATYLDVNSQGDRLFYPFGKKTKAANIERRILDPALREKAEQHPNITVFYGYRVKSLIHDLEEDFQRKVQKDFRQGPDQISGITAQNNTGHIIQFACPLVIAADGRKSKVAKLDYSKDNVVKNHRIALFSYFKTNQTITPSSVWALDKGDAYIACFPNTDKVLLSCYIPESKYIEIKANAQDFYNEYVVHFIKEQGIHVGEQTDELFIAKDTSTLYRSPNSKGLVFVGDAFLAADPLTGIGCSWAMSSADLLSKCLSKSLKAYDAKDLDSSKATQSINRRIKLYAGIHRIKYLIPAYIMAWMSLKGRIVFNERLFGLLARVLGKKADKSLNNSSVIN